MKARSAAGVRFSGREGEGESFLEADQECVEKE